MGQKRFWHINRNTRHQGLNNKRSDFSHSSEIIYFTIKSFGLKQGNLFAIFCPMTFDSKVIQNPYMALIYQHEMSVKKYYKPIFN